MSISGGGGYTSYTCGLNKSVITVAAKYQLTANYIVRVKVSLDDSYSLESLTIVQGSLDDSYSLESLTIVNNCIRVIC